MRLIKISIGNINTTVGAFRSNTDKAIAQAKVMGDRAATVGVFSEQVISGYPAEDLVEWQEFVASQVRELHRFAKDTEMFCPVFVLGLAVGDSGNIYNAAAVIHRGKILGIVPKEKLPTYGVFYERRTFSAGFAGLRSEISGIPFGDLIFSFPFGTMAVEICEDIWSPDGPMRRRSYSGAELIVNISASPWRAGVADTRRAIVATRAADNVAAVVYANQVGGNDSLVFDGGGFVNQAGRMIGEAPRWREGVSDFYLDLDRITRLRRENTTWRSDCEAFLKSEKATAKIDGGDGPLPNHESFRYPTPKSKSFFMSSDEPVRNPRHEYFDDLMEAMIAGLAGYFEKTKAFERIGIALSGGKDSALTLLVAHSYAVRRFAHLPEPERRAKLKDFIHCVSMPTRFNSEETKTLARELSEDLGVTFVEAPIEAAYNEGLALLKAMHSGEIPAITLQNIQPRIRGSAMWNWTNATRGMWLQTGNMSEKAVGYTTVGGDLMGAYSLIGNMPKTVVIELLRHLAGRYESRALKRLLETRASAELEADQEDEKDLMPFPVLDACYALFAEEKLMPYEVYKVLRGMWSDSELSAMRSDFTPALLKEWVIRFVKLFRASIFKWVQSPQAVHLSSLDLDRERALQLPVVQSPEWLALEELEKLEV